MAGEFLYAVARLNQSKMPGPDKAAFRAQEQLPATLDHVNAHVVHERTGGLFAPPDTNVVTRVSARAATAMRGQQVVPAIVVDHRRSFAVDGQVNGLLRRLDSLPGLGIKLHDLEI